MTTKFQKKKGRKEETIQQLASTTKAASHQSRDGAKDWQVDGNEQIQTK